MHNVRPSGPPAAQAKVALSPLAIACEERLRRLEEVKVNKAIQLNMSCTANSDSNNTRMI